MAVKGTIKEKFARTVFGRVSVQHNDATWILEMQQGALFVRKKRCRKKHRIEFADLVDLSQGQFSLRFGAAEKKGKSVEPND